MELGYWSADPRWALSGVRCDHMACKRKAGGQAQREVRGAAPAPAGLEGPLGAGKGQGRGPPGAPEGTQLCWHLDLSHGTHFPLQTPEL